MFNAIFELMNLSTVTRDALNGASVAFTSNLGKVFVVSLAIALGVGAGLSLVQPLFSRHPS
jgi:hypothetical protein